MLYEMLTGEVPFKGESWAEIAIKHQTDLPDMSRVPSAYIPILEKALNKKADRRFSDMNAMIQVVEVIGRPTPTATPAYFAPTRPEDRPAPRHPPSVTPTPLPANAGWRSRLNELATSLVLAPLLAIPATAVWALFKGDVNWGVLASLLLLMTGAAWAVLFAAKFWEGRDGGRPRRLFLALCGAAVGTTAFWLDGWSFPEVMTHDETTPPGLQSYWGGVLRAERGGVEALAGYVLFFALMLCVPRWWLAAERRRPERFTLYPLLVAGAWGLILLSIWRNALMPNHMAPPGFLVLAVAGAAAVVQVVSPWTPNSPSTTRYRRRLNPAAVR
jgi:hypothetical protein